MIFGKRVFSMSALGLLCCLLVFVLFGCTPTPNEEPQIQIGTFTNRYELYEPVATVENVTCDLGTIPSEFGAQLQLHVCTVDSWKSYKLEKRDNGSFVFNFNVERNERYIDWTPPADNPYLYCNISLTCNFDHLQEEQFAYRPAYKMFDTDGTLIYEHHTDFFLWVVDELTLQHETEHAHWFNRTWWYRIFTVQWVDESHIVLNEYSLHRQYSCEHNDAGDEIWDNLSIDNWLHDRFISQNYTPSISKDGV